MKLDNVDGFSFEFTDALDAFVFDEKDKSSPKYHGQPMKAVDMVVELEDVYLFIEIKDYYDAEDYNLNVFTDENDLKEKRKRFKWLKNYLKYKYRDSYLFRYAEKKVDKPIHYICLLTFDNALNIAMQKALRQELPVGKASGRWRRELVKSCQVLNIDKWNQQFPKWPACRVA